MAPKTNKSAPGTKVYNFAEHPTRIGEIAAAIAQTQKIIILCGPGVLSIVPSKDVPIQLAHNGYKSTTTLRAAIDDCSTLNPHAKQLSQDKLAAFSVAMTRLRIQARTAALTPFHQFLQRAFVEERVVLCLTQNFDGLGERDSPQAGGHVVMINGDNRWLRCCMPTCKGANPRQATDLDTRLLSAEIVPCSDCTAEGLYATRSAPFPLRPLSLSRQDEESACSWPSRSTISPSRGAKRHGKARDAVLEATEGCDLLLVVGVSLKSRATFQLVRDMAAAIHAQYGAVIYVDRQAIKGIKTDHCIDFHLQVDAQLCSQRIMRAMDEVDNAISSLALYVANDDVGMMSLDNNDPLDLWYNHYVRPAPRVYNEEPEESAPHMAMLVYFLDQFWPQTKHLCALVAGRWKSLGWPCYVEPIKLEEVCDKRDILADWCAPSNRDTLGSSHIDSLHTLFLRMCQGGPLIAVCLDSDSGGIFNALVGCLNKKLAPAFVVNLVVRVTTSVVGTDESPGEEMFNCWLSDGLACNHTDLVYLAKGLPSFMWLFSPFNSRPLGKELPNLLGVCSCQRDSVPGGDDQPTRRKIWIVSHDGSARHGTL
ncbi:hypothetical protein FRC10_009556, partial [Ceratobasidium sp. 414]